MNKLTLEDIEKVIDTEEYIKMGKKTVVGVITTKTGFEIVGSESCVDPINFDMQIGKSIVRQNIINKLWELEGYLLQYKNHCSCEREKED